MVNSEFHWKCPKTKLKITQWCPKCVSVFVLLQVQRCSVRYRDHVCAGLWQSRCCRCNICKRLKCDSLKRISLRWSDRPCTFIKDMHQHRMEIEHRCQYMCWSKSQKCTYTENLTNIWIIYVVDKGLNRASLRQVECYFSVWTDCTVNTGELKKPSLGKGTKCLCKMCIFDVTIVFLCGSSLVILVLAKL